MPFHSMCLACRAACVIVHGLIMIVITGVKLLYINDVLVQLANLAQDVLIFRNADELSAQTLLLNIPCHVRLS